MDEKARRNLGAHYTCEENILKLIKPLFLDELWAEFGKVKGNRNKLFDFHKQLRTLTFLDPACGCGNFLVITYRELRKLELEILRASLALERESGQRLVDIQQLVTVDVDQFYGIEIEEFPAQIAQVALWLVDHQMNTRISEEFGNYFARIPLTSTPHIHNGNALRSTGTTCCRRSGAATCWGIRRSWAQSHDDEQREDIAARVRRSEGLRRAGFRRAWYCQGSAVHRSARRFACAFVSTN